MQVILPVTKLSELHLAIDNVLVSVHLEAGSIAWCYIRRTYVFPAEESVVDVSECLVAASARSTIFFCCKERLLNIGFVSLVISLEEKLCDL